MAVKNRTHSSSKRKPTSSKRVAVYARRSKDDGDKTVSLPEQVAACRRYAAEQGWGAIVCEKTENRSGTSGFDRPVFRELVQAGQEGQYDVLLTLDMSRFGRFDADERGYWLTELKRAGVEVRHVMDDARLEGEAGPIMGAVLQTSQREHSFKTGYKVAVGAWAAVERGCWPGGTPPFGYRLERRQDFDGTGRRDSKVRVVAAESAVVRQVFGLRTEREVSYAKIATILNDGGKRTRKGRLWTRSSVRILLQNPAYKGILERGRGRGAADAKFFHASADGPVKVDEGAPAGYQVSNVIPPIVSEEVWEAAQAVGRTMRARFGGRPTGIVNHGKHLLTGLCVCGACGQAAIANSGSTTSRKRYAYYVCGHKRRGSEHTESCKLVRAQTDALADAVLEQVRGVAQSLDPNAIMKALKRRLATRPTDPSRDLPELKRKRARLKQKARDLALGTGDLDREILDTLREEDARLASLIQVEERREKVAQGLACDMEGRIESAVAAACRLEIPSSQEERDLAKVVLRSFVKKIRILPSPLRKPKRVELELYTPEGLGELFTSGEVSSTSRPTLSRPGSSATRAAGQA